MLLFVFIFFYYIYNLSGLYYFTFVFNLFYSPLRNIIVVLMKPTSFYVQLLSHRM